MSLQEKRRAKRVPGASNEKPTGSVSRGTYKSSPEGQKRYDATKTDIEAKRLLKKAGASGDVSPTAPKNVRDRVKEIRQKRADKLGTPDPFDPDYDKKTKPVDGRTKVGKVFKSTKPVTTSAPGFGKGDTPGEIRVKGLEKKAFKKTQPSDIKLPKSFTQFSRDLQDYKDRNLPGGPRKSSTKSKTSGTPLTRQDVGMAPPDKSRKKAENYTKKINQQNKNRPESGTPMRKGATNIPKDTSKDIQVKKMRDRVDQLVKDREAKRSVTGKKDVKGMRGINREIRQYQKSIKRNPFVPVKYDASKESSAINKELSSKSSRNRVTTGSGRGATTNVTFNKDFAKDPDLSRMSAKDRATYQKIKDTTPKGGIPKWMKKFDKKYPIKSFKKAATPAAKAFSKAGPVGKLAAGVLAGGALIYGANQVRKAFAGAGKPKAPPVVKGSALRYNTGPKKGQKKYFDIKTMKRDYFTKSDFRDNKGNIDAGFGKPDRDKKLIKRLKSTK